MNNLIKILSLLFLTNSIICMNLEYDSNSRISNEINEKIESLSQEDRQIIDLFEYAKKKVNYLKILKI